MALPRVTAAALSSAEGASGGEGAQCPLGLALLLPGVGTWKSTENREGPGGRSGERDW